MEYTSKKKLIPVRNTTRFKASSNITSNLIQKSIDCKIKEYGISAYTDSCTVSNGLLGDDEYGIAVIHPDHRSDYYKFCIICNKDGTTYTVDVYTYGQSSNIKHEEYAANTKIFTGSGARGAAAGIFKGGAFGVGAAAGSIVGSAVGVGFRAIGKGINALMRDEAGLEREQRWYAAINDILSEILDYEEFYYENENPTIETVDNSNFEPPVADEVVTPQSSQDDIISNISIEQLEYAIQQGDSYAKGLLGVKYTLGDGVPENKEKAFQLFKEAANEGDVLSQKNLGLCYMFGDGVARSDYFAAQWFEKSAEQGNACAKVQLANLLVNADGVEQNHSKAENLYQEVVNQFNLENSSDSPTEQTDALRVDVGSYNDAVFGLSLLYFVYYRHYSKAFPLLKISAEKGYAEAQYHLGIAYRYARGTENNNKLAKYWFEEALNNGYKEAEPQLNALENESYYETEKRINSELSKTEKGCYIATAVYGSYDCPHVWTLRRFRDYYLDQTWYGRTFIKIYYAVSPTLVKWLGDSTWFIKLCRGRLDKLVRELQNKGYDSTRYYDN